MKDWAIRSQAPKSVNDEDMEKVQRLDGDGSLFDGSNQPREGIRYSLLLDESQGMSE